MTAADDHALDSRNKIVPERRPYAAGMRALVACLLTCVTLACSTAGGGAADDDGAGGDDDGASEVPDAAPGPADGAVDHADAAPGAPDAAVGAADAAVGMPDAAVPAPDAGGPIVGLPYPARDAYHIKGVNPDFWSNRNELVTHQIGAISLNMIWSSWEPVKDAPPCSASQQEYDGRCFKIDQQTDAEIAAYSALGVAVTGIVYGVPSWARTGNTGCSPEAPGFEIFCSPDNPADFGRFAGMLAQRYDGLHGHGRIADFVIHNEVNTNVWYDVGCGQGVPCDQATWIQTYANDYVAAYDRIKAHQSEAKVLVSFDIHFGAEFDQPGATFSVIGAKTFMEQLAPKLGDRRWQIAYHPYPADLFATQFGPLDLPALTYGNLGVLLAWLRASFPTRPHAWEVQLTESGFNSNGPKSSEAAQADAACRGLRNVLGTPGITSYIYHRMKDHPADGAWLIGMRRSDDSAKPSWSIWANANRVDLSPPQLSCGFEDLPYTRLTRSGNGDLIEARGARGRAGHVAPAPAGADGRGAGRGYRRARSPTRRQPSRMSQVRGGVTGGGVSGGGGGVRQPVTQRAEEEHAPEW
jgi:hypothetical protein